jgi:hypothetical protein
VPINESNATGYNLRRAQSFAAAGINDSDVRYAHPNFVGKGMGDCSLCGKKSIQWHYEIRFDAPDLIDGIVSIGKEITREGVVTFLPVGSDCIQTWADPLPESKEKLEFLLRWKRELSKCNEAKAVQATNSLFVKLGFAGTDDVLARSKALVAAQVATLSWGERKALRDASYKLGKARKLTSERAKGLAAAILKAEAVVVATVAPTAPVTPPPPAAPAQPAATVDPVLTRAEVVLADPAALARLSTYDASVVKDIVAKVKKYKGKFASSRQRSYLEALVKKAEAAPAQIVEETVEAESLSPVMAGVEGFVSPSKIAGARY